MSVTILFFLNFVCLLQARSYDTPIRTNSEFREEMLPEDLLEGSMPDIYNEPPYDAPSPVKRAPESMNGHMLKQPLLRFDLLWRKFTEKKRFDM